jgi:hypothetical protein
VHVSNILWGTPRPKVRRSDSSPSGREQKAIIRDLTVERLSGADLLSPKSSRRALSVGLRSTRAPLNSSGIGRSLDLCRKNRVAVR